MQYRKCSNAVIPPVPAERFQTAGSCCKLVELTDEEFESARRAAETARKERVALMSAVVDSAEEDESGFRSN